MAGLMHDLRLNEERGGFFFCRFVPLGTWIVFHSFAIDHEACEQPLCARSTRSLRRKPLTAGT